MKLNFVQKTMSTLRGRLSLWYLTSVGLIIALFLAAVSGLFWVTLQEQIDHHVHIVVNEAKQVVENYRGNERDNLIKNLVSARGMTVVVLSPDGLPILETNSPDVALVTEHQLQQILTSSSLYESAPIHFTGSNIRFATMPVTVSAGKGIVAVGYSTKVLDDTFFRILSIVIAILFFLVLPITYFGHQLLRKQLRPLESIASQAKVVTDTSSLSKRITISSPTLELQTIQETLNSMLTKLEGIFTNEREFFSDAAHTLKTPLAVIRSQVESSNLTQQVREGMLQTIDKASETVQDLLFLSRIGSKAQKPETVSLTDMTNDLTELATVLGEDKKLAISSNIQKEVNIKADKKLLQRALSNIVHNAITYSKPQDSVDIQLREQSGRITVTVKDTGVGISQKDLSSVFSRFFRGANANEKGSGLGLAISKAVVESLGGKITISSVINKGTTVTVVFP